MNTDLSQDFPEPRIYRYIFANPKVAWIWLVIRLYVGFIWIEAGWSKWNNSAWVGDNGGVALRGFIKGAMAKIAGEHPDVQGWYALFLSFVDQHAVIFSHLVTYGEIAVGLGLILGIFTGIAAFFGSFMSMNFLLAGAVSINPILAVLQLFLMLAWRIAGWWGFDRWLLPKFGVPWKVK